MTTIAQDALSDRQKQAIRRLCGYSTSVREINSFDAWRFYQSSGTLDYRISVLVPVEIKVVIQYIETLLVLEANLPQDNMGDVIVDTTTWRPDIDEVRSKHSMFDDWRRRLCGFLGVPAGPKLLSPGAISLSVK